MIVAKSVSSLPDDLSPEDFEAAIDQTVLEFSEGDIIEGTVVNMDQDEVLVDIGYKSEGVIPANELSIRKNVPPSEVVSIGERVEALVLDKEDDEGRLILSKKRAQYERAWGKIQEITDGGGTVKGSVIEVVKGGLIVDIGLRGFLPASLVELRRVRDLDPYIGTEIEAKVIELDRNRNNVVLSRRAYLEEEQQEQRQAFLDDLAEGEVRDGMVSSVVNFGAFVDLGGMDGLVHVSELSWRHVNHPSEVVKVGDKVTVKVLEVDLGRERISLSIKQTETDPWEAFNSAHELGDVVEGTVTKTVPFGAFVSVGAGVEGLVHVSEIALHRVESPELELTLNQKVQVKITEMDEERRRVSLSIKQALPEWQTREERQPPRRRQPEVREFEREEDKEEERSFDVDASLEAILQELKERGIGRR
ncbi:MAG: 30S ribosomal protein S1 [Acidimicrobiia bacterium]|nr:30S ribosomal protein S1 [Acidimicrobiia bacterium]